MWGQMQTIVFHGFAYTCCTASSQLFCGMSAIRFNVLDDRAFPQVCSRTLVKCKGSGFLGISVACGGIFAFGTRFVGKSVAKLNYSLEKVFVCHKWYTFIRRKPLYHIGCNSASDINIIPEMV